MSNGVSSCKSVAPNKYIQREKCMKSEKYVCLPVLLLPRMVDVLECSSYRI